MRRYSLIALTLASNFIYSACAITNFKERYPYNIGEYRISTGALDVFIRHSKDLGEIGNQEFMEMLREIDKRSDNDRGINAFEAQQAVKRIKERKTERKISL